MFVASHLRDPRRDRAVLAATLLALAGLAWLSLWVWAASPYGRYLHHEGVPGSLVLEIGLFDLGWVLMIVAMMLPSSVPLVITFAALVGRRRRPGRLVALLLVGYLVVWAGFGLAAWVLDRGIHGAVEAVPWLAAHPQLILGDHAPRRGAVAVQPAPGPLSRRVPQPARLRDEPLARHLRAT